jgi:hypothetical protein
MTHRAGDSKSLMPLYRLGIEGKFAEVQVRRVTKVLVPPRHPPLFHLNNMLVLLQIWPTIRRALAARSPIQPFAYSV